METLARLDIELERLQTLGQYLNKAAKRLERQMRWGETYVPETNEHIMASLDRAMAQAIAKALAHASQIGRHRCSVAESRKTPWKAFSDSEFVGEFLTSLRREMKNIGGSPEGLTVANSDYANFWSPRLWKLVGGKIRYDSHVFLTMVYNQRSFNVGATEVNRWLDTAHTIDTPFDSPDFSEMEAAIRASQNVLESVKKINLVADTVVEDLVSVLSGEAYDREREQRQAHRR